MEMAVILLLLLLGIALTVKGGDVFVDAAIALSAVFQLPPLFVGATIVAFATVLPELFVSAIAAFQGGVQHSASLAQMALGNTLGSIICNTGLVLGLAVACRPGKAEGEAFGTKLAMLLIGVALAFVLLLDGRITPGETVSLFMLMAAYAIAAFQEARGRGERAISAMSTPVAKRKSVPGGRRFIFKSLGLLGGASFAMVIGAHLLVKQGSSLARLAGIPESIIAITVLAFGTALPELVTTITAISKKQSELSVGNILGANVMNLALVLPVSAWLSREGLPVSWQYVPVLNGQVAQTLVLDLPVIAILCLLLGVLPWLRGHFRRGMGIAALGVYALYIITLLSCAMM